MTAEAGPPAVSVCQFCENEPPILGATAASFLMGQFCYDRSLSHGVTWNEDTPFETIRKALGFRAPKDNGQGSGL